MNSVLELMLKCREIAADTGGLPYFPFVEYGRQFSYPDDNAPDYHLLLNHYRFRPQQCYKNAQRVILSDINQEFRYWEGFYAVAPHFVPLHHAWLTFNDKLVDVTLEVAGREAAHYVGITIPHKLVWRFLCENKVHSPMTEDFRFIRHLLKETPAWLKKQKTSPSISTSSPKRSNRS